MSEVWYLAGRMTGIPQFNFPRFSEVAGILRDQGYTLIVPSEQDTKAVQAAAWASPDGEMDAEGKVGDSTWGDILAKDVKIVADEIHGVIAMDDWWLSRGARLECFVALSCGKPVIQYSDIGLTYPARSEIVRYIQENL